MTCSLEITFFETYCWKKPKQTSGLQTVIHSTFVDIISNLSPRSHSFSHMPNQKLCHLNTGRNHTDTFEHIHVYLCIHASSKPRVGGKTWGNQQRSASQLGYKQHMCLAKELEVLMDKDLYNQTQQTYSSLMEKTAVVSISNCSWQDKNLCRKLLFPMSMDAAPWQTHSHQRMICRKGQSLLKWSWRCTVPNQYCCW